MPFRSILETLVETHAPLIQGAIFCDDEGEKVDAFGTAEMNGYDLDLFGASYASVAQALPAGSCMRVVHASRVIWVATVEEGYYLLAVCGTQPSGAVRDELPRAVAALAAHM